MTTYDPDELQRLGRRHKRLRDELAALQPELREQILAAIEAEVPQVEIVKATGYTRDAIYKMATAAGRR